MFQEAQHYQLGRESKGNRKTWPGFEQTIDRFNNSMQRRNFLRGEVSID